jgi:putative methyltransferase (TIGR04325 family)
VIQPYLKLLPSSSSLPRPAKRLRDYLRLLRELIGETRETRDQVHATRAALGAQLEQVEARASEQAVEVTGLRAQLTQLIAQVDAANSSRTAEHAQLREILRLIHDRALWRRERLRELRIGAAYERPYAEANPLVSVVIPTFDNHDLLRERAIPSVLAQTYQNFEIVVVGDAASDEARIAIEGFDDPRITYFNLDYRGPYPAAPEQRWLIAGTPPFNEAVRRASGLWIAPLDDDDAFRPHHIERLLTYVRDHHLELGYGRIRVHSLDGVTTTIGRFPPEREQFALQSALYHAGLANIFELELVDAQLGLANDWAWCLRLMEAGVRIGMLEEESADYYPSREWTPRWGAETDRNDDLAAATADRNQAETPAPAPEWEFVPEGWERAHTGGDLALRGWNAEEVARSYREKWPRFLEAIEGSGPLGVSHEVRAGAPIGRQDVTDQNAVLAYAYALARAADGSKTVSVLDWGGAFAHYYVLARRLFPELQLDYHCRELPAVSAEGRRVLAEVTFHETDDCLNRSYDFVLVSNALQYDEDWVARLDQLAGATQGRLFLTRVPITRHAGSFVVLQRAEAYGYATEYLGWVLNRDELLAAAHGTGLALEREFVFVWSWSIPGAPEDPSLTGFLFTKAPGLP